MMRGVLLALLMCLLPMQFGFAAAAAYCAKEADRTAPHFGHHEHEVAVAEPASSGHPLDDNGTPCEACHMGATAAVDAGTREPLFVPQLRAFQPRVSSLSPQHIPSPPQRPPIAGSR